jgi:chromatin remodeling complex protein RSC6
VIQYKDVQYENMKEKFKETKRFVLDRDHIITKLKRSISVFEKTSSDKNERNAKPETSLHKNVNKKNDLHNQNMGKAKEIKRLQEKGKHEALEDNDNKVRMKSTMPSISKSPCYRTSIGFSKLMKVSEDLKAIIGKGEASRAECIRELWTYLKKNNLKDPENGQFFNPDKKMAKVFGTKKIRAFSMSKYLNAHLSNPV